jgi:hypothetical protein
MQLNFKQWLNEGFWLKTQELPDSARKEFAELAKGLMEGKVSKTAFIRFLIDMHNAYGIFNFIEEDRPADFIHIEPLNKAQSLPTMEIKDRLPDFEGVNVFYGFKFVPAKKYTSTLVNFTWETRYKQLRKNIEQYKHIEPLLPYLDKVKEAIDKAGGMYQAASQLLQKMGIRITPEQVGEIFNLGSLLQQEEDLKTKSPVFTGKGAKTFLNAMQQAFLKVLKHGKSAQLRDQFIDMAINHFARLNSTKCYDYIIYPPSSSKFNEELALGFSAKYTNNMGGRCIAEPLDSFEKRDDVEIDMFNLVKQFGKEKAKEKAAYLQSQIALGKGEIKNIHSRDKHFLRMFKPTTGNEIKYKNKMILVVDDNIASGATMQQIHHILRKQYPKRIDIYTPLYVEFYH